MASAVGVPGDSPAAGRIRVTYRFSVEAGTDPAERVRAAAWEQTVELAPGSVSREVEARAVGRVEEVSEAGPGAWRGIISYPADAWGGDLTQLLNLIWGNVSLQPDVRVDALELPDDVLSVLGGPAYGIRGIRDAVGVEGRALLCGALKPLGSSLSELAETAGKLALGGADLVKDDHSLADQAWAPFRERVRRCRDAVEEANARSGGRTLYLPNVTADPGALEERFGVALEEGCAGVLVNAVPAGIPVLRTLRARKEAFLLVHPSLAGGLLGRDHGFAADVLLGTLFRAAGADGVVYPNVGGRFPFDEETCRALNGRLREPLGELRRTFPMPGGGIDVERIPHWTEAYGYETVFLVGGSLYARPDLVAATRRLMDELEAHGSDGGQDGI